MTTTLTLATNFIRKRAEALLRQCPQGWRVTFAEPTRSDAASERFWAALRHFAVEADHYGEKLPAETWRDIFLHALGREIKMVRALDGDGVLPVRVSTKKLTVTEMSDLIELVYSVGSRRGIVFREPRLEPDWQPRRGAKKPLITQSKMLQIESKTNAV
jgi:hypothetical protein